MPIYLGIAHINNNKKISSSKILTWYQSKNPNPTIFFKNPNPSFSCLPLKKKFTFMRGYYSSWTVSWTVRGIVHLKKTSHRSIYLHHLLANWSPTRHNHHKFYIKSISTPSKFLCCSSTEFLVPDHLCSTRQHSLLCFTVSISPLIISNHLHSNSCSATLYHLPSSLLLLPTVSAESTVTIYCSYCII